MLVTINTDASYSPINRRAGYAFWAVCDEFRIQKSGVFRDKCMNPNDAEAKCILNALKVVTSANKNITKIIVNTDSLNAIALLKYDREHMRKYIGDNMKMWKHLRIVYAEFRRIKGLQIEFRHVKAHSGLKDKRSYVNEWCNFNAKLNLRKTYDKE